MTNGQRKSRSVSIYALVFSLTVTTIVLQLALAEKLILVVTPYWKEKSNILMISARIIGWLGPHPLYTIAAFSCVFLTATTYLHKKKKLNQNLFFVAWVILASVTYIISVFACFLVAESSN